MRECNAPHTINPDQTNLHTLINEGQHTLWRVIFGVVENKGKKSVKPVKHDAVRPGGIVIYDYNSSPMLCFPFGIVATEFGVRIFRERKNEMARLEVLCDASTLLWEMSGVFYTCVPSGLNIANNWLA